MRCYELFPRISLFSCRKRTFHLIIVTKRYSECISRIQRIVINFNAKRFLDHQTNLFLRSGAITANGDLSLSRGIFRYLKSLFHSHFQSHTLRPGQFENDLSIFSHKRRLYGQMFRFVIIARFRDITSYHHELLICILFLTQIQNSGVYELRLPLLIYTNYPETK